MQAFDWNGLHFSFAVVFWGWGLILEVYIAIPFISAAIGWITNRIAIEMLFRPQEPVRILFFNFQGVFPKRREMIAEKLSNAISKHFISQKDLEKFLAFDQSTEDEVLVILERRIDYFLENDLAELFPMSSLFIGDETRYTIKKAILTQALLALPEIKEKMKQSALNSIDLESIVREKARALSFSKLEEVLKSVLNKELRFVEIMGAVLGFFIGTLQTLLVYATV